MELLNRVPQTESPVRAIHCIVTDALHTIGPESVSEDHIKVHGRYKQVGIRFSLVKPIIIFLLPLAIFAHRYRVPTDPNDAPFLPIFPVYPYNPKLMKRGVEKDHSYGHINSELYAPKPDAKDSYTTKYNGNYHRDSHSSTPPTQSVYQPSYISSNQPYAQSTAYTPGSSIPSQYYNTNPYLYTIYNGYPVALVTQSHSVNPRLPNNYYYQQQYHPNYHQAYSSGVESSQIGHEHDGKLFGKFQDTLKNELNTKDATQFIDGTNYLTNSKELETSTSTYRLPSNVNQENDISNVHLRSAQLPRTMFQIVPYDGQQFKVANYAVASGYKYPQLSQQLINQAVENGFGQPAIANVAQGQYDISQVNSNLSGKNNLQLQSPVIAKTGLAYVMNSGSFNISPRHIPKAMDSYQNLDSSMISIRNQKPMTTVTVEGSHGLYIPPTKLYKHQSQLPEYNSYTTQNGQVYNGLTSSMLVDYKKNEQNYSTEDIQQTQPDQSYSYQYSGYLPTSSNQQQLDNYKITLDDVNYASKRNS
ncbi:hypothetical protein PV325_000859 [Microctonus aethiopoides]|nr:hypothetical protein PV325_000859 [Microctonus aethiopoides]